MPPSIRKRIDHVPDVLDGNELVHKRTGKPLRIPRRVKTAILAILSGAAKNATIAAEQVGLSREHLSRMINRPHVQVFIADERRRTIAQASLRAAGRLSELIDAESEHVSLQASQHVLAIEGISPPERGNGVQVNVNVTPGYVVRLRHVDGAELEGQAVDVTPPAAGEPVAGETNDRPRR